MMIGKQRAVSRIVRRLTGGTTTTMIYMNKNDCRSNYKLICHAQMSPMILVANDTLIFE